MIVFQLENNGFKIIKKIGIYFGIPIFSRYISYFKHVKCSSSFLSFDNIYVAEKAEYINKRLEYLKKRLEEKRLENHENRNSRRQT